jgi:hypothetical protein
MAQEHRVAEDATVIVTTPNFSVNRSAEQRRSSVPSALRTSAPGYAGRWNA